MVLLPREINLFQQAIGARVLDEQCTRNGVVRTEKLKHDNR